LGGVRLGEDWQTLLRRAGQPQQRTRAWSWCVSGKRNGGAADVAVLNDAGKVQLVGSTAHGRSASGVAVGTSATRVDQITQSGGPGLRIRPAGGITWVYAVRSGRVRAVAVASNALARRPAALRLAAARLLVAQASRTMPGFVPSDAQAATRGAPTGRTLAGSIDPNLNTALAFLCHLQVQ
jgi:hypothetical protein